jgi:hypothetical protein
MASQIGNRYVVVQGPITHGIDDVSVTPTRQVARCNSAEDATRIAFLLNESEAGHQAVRQFEEAIRKDINKDAKS